ncbi:hypothetical protein [Streptomyces sp. NPDC050988]
MPTAVQFENFEGTSYVEGTDCAKLHDDAFGQMSRQPCRAQMRAVVAGP